MTVVLGVDPGVTGALAFLSTEGALVIHDMPTLELITAKGGKRRYVNPDRLLEIFQWVHEEPDQAFIEKQWGQKGDGVIQAFGLGDAYGCIRTAVAAYEIAPNYVPSVTWKRWLKVPQGKDGGRQRALELFPACKHLFARKKDHGRADAALIALWGMAQIGKVRLNWARKEEGAAAS